MLKYQVDLEKLKEVIHFIDELNDQDLENIEVFHNGEFKYISPNEIKEWQYVGLSNVTFLKETFKDELK
jgi:hypothetical protein